MTLGFRARQRLAERVEDPELAVGATNRGLIEREIVAENVTTRVRDHPIDQASGAGGPPEFPMVNQHIDRDRAAD
jgi:hypothetical protein